MKQTKQIVSSNFTTVVLEMASAIKDGWSVVDKGEGRPFHMVMGKFSVTLTKDVSEASMSRTEPALSSEVEPEVVGVSVQPKQQQKRGRK